MFNRLICFTIRSITETLKCLNVLILFLAILTLNYSGKNNFHLIAISGLILYALTTASIKFINKSNTKKILKFFTSMIFNFMISFVIIISIPWEYKPFCLLYFLGTVFFASIHYDNVIDDFDSFIKRYGLSTLLLIITVFCFQASPYFQVIKIYFSLYIIMSILYIAQVNVLEKYGSLSVNIINENKNIRRFNTLSITLTIISILTLTTDIFKRIYYFVSYMIETLLYIFLKPVSWFMLWIHDIWFYKRIKEGFSKIKRYEDDKNVENTMKEIKEEFEIKVKNYDSTTALAITKILITMIFIVIICVLIYVIYKKVMNIQTKAIKLDILDGEQRRFVFKKAKSEKCKEKKPRENMKNLHVIRRIYIDVINILKSKGVVYKKSYTPNEYNSVIENTEFKSKNIDQLINTYNKLRYGNKNISKEDISMAYKIKEDL